MIKNKTTAEKKAKGKGQTTKTVLTPRIVVMGVGGAGSNIAQNMIQHGQEKTAPKLDIDYIVCNTDVQALSESSCQTKIALGPKRTQGMGAGANPECGEQAAIESIDDVMSALKNTDMLVLTGGMGGGTGSGALPCIAKHAHEAGILVLAIVTTPFSFEGAKRMGAAVEYMDKLKESADTMIVVSNQNLYSVNQNTLAFKEGFKTADAFLRKCITSIVSIIKVPGMINVDFADLCTVMRGRKGRALMGIGYASGENKGLRAAEDALANMLFDFGELSWTRINKLLVLVEGNDNLTMEDVETCVGRIRKEVDADAQIIMGTTFNNNIEGENSSEDKIKVFIMGTSDSTKLSQDKGKDDIYHFANNDFQDDSKYSFGELHETSSNEYSTETTKNSGFLDKLFGIKHKKTKNKSDDLPEWTKDDKEHTK